MGLVINIRKPRIWFRYGKWHCAAGNRAEFKATGVSPRQAYFGYLCNVEKFITENNQWVLR